MANESGMITDSRGVEIGQVFDNPDSGIDPLGREQSDYNSALITAAPDLLSALKETIVHAKNYLNQVSVQIVAQGPYPYESFLTQRDRAMETLKKANAAITKAERVAAGLSTPVAGSPA